jgi:hypothetical protein
MLHRSSFAAAAVRGSWAFISIFVCTLSTPAFAVEGSSAAGPIGGTDIRSAQLPPPGVYGGTVLFYAEAHQFFDAHNKVIPALSSLDLSRARVAPFLIYVPDVQLLGGSIGIGGIVPIGAECGHLFDVTPKRCISGVGDPYVEVAWSRHFGTMRRSKDPGAFPIAEGLTLALGFGTVIPVGNYDVTDATVQGLTLGNNIWTFAPTIAATYVTKPILADGTEISAKLYWNNYLKNPGTQYATGSLVDVDFAVTEKIGRFQFGLAGYYNFQVADDKQFGATVPPDGRRAEVLSLGAVLAYDMPQYGASVKIKALQTVIEHNAVRSPGAAVSWIKKF